MPCNCILTQYNALTGIPVISAISGGKRTYVIILKDGTNNDSPPLDLSDASKVLFIVKASDESTEYYINKEVTVTDADKGEVTMTLRKSELTENGMWYGAFLVKDDEDSTLAQYKVWLRIERSVEDTIGNPTLTFAEIREALYDRCGDDNPLLHGVEFSDNQIMSAMQRPVDEWNETPPDVGIYTSVTFPFRNAWIDGTLGNLMQMASLRYLRNDLTYSAGSTQVNDMNKGPAYAQLSTSLLKIWKEWMLAKKRALNIEQGFGFVTIGAFNSKRRY